MRKNLKLGIFGFGCVGQGLYHVLQKTHGIKAEVKKICVKNPHKERIIDSSYFTFQKEDILNDPEIDVVIELIDDANAALEIVRESLKRGKAVVTANKKMLAENLEEIYQLQQQYQKPILYEGAVCGSIPIIRNLEEYYDNDLLTSIEGIFNGSTNYILTKVFNEKKTYADSLKKAQELGFAESDPTLDVKGFDPKYKLTIAIAHTFGIFERPENIINLGIDKISSLDLKFAREHGLTIKLIARAQKINGKIYAIVAPQFIPEDHPLSHVNNEYNAAVVEGAFSEKQTFVGKGAGSYPTGSAVLSDISALTFDYRYEYKKRNQHEDLQLSNAATVDVQISFEGAARIRLDDFELFKVGFKGNGHQFLSGLVKLEKLSEWSTWEGVSIILNPGNPIQPLVETKKEVLTLA